MKKIAAGEFKQTCLKLLDEVRETGETLVVTKRGVPVAQVTPVQPVDDWEGVLSDRGKILGDLVEPATDPEEWEALR